MSTRPVFVYGASGYTGRLVCEYLREYGIPFTAAGRDKKRVEEAMAAVPGIETADYDVVEVSHDVASLTEALKGRKILCNIVGPFITRAEVALEAALAAGVHYVDTTGEQASIITAKENWGAKFEEAGLTCAPATSYMYVPSEIVAHLVLETPGIDTLDGLTLFDGLPTETSTQSIYVQLKEKAYYLSNNKLEAWSKTEGFEVQLPGRHESLLALPWGGTGNPVWFLDDLRVRNCRCLSGVANRPLMTGVLEMQRDYEENLASLPEEEQEKILFDRANEVQQGMPPRENPHEQRTVDSMKGRGNLAYAEAVLMGVGAYKQTGLVQAVAARHIVNGAPLKTGFSSPCSAFGYREFLTQLEAFGLTRRVI